MQAIKNQFKNIKDTKGENHLMKQFNLADDSNYDKNYNLSNILQKKDKFLLDSVDNHKKDNTNIAYNLLSNMSTNLSHGNEKNNSSFQDNQKSTKPFNLTNDDYLLDSSNLFNINDINKFNDVNGNNDIYGSSFKSLKLFQSNSKSLIQETKFRNKEATLSKLPFNNKSKITSVNNSFISRKRESN